MKRRSLVIKKAFSLIALLSLVELSHAQKLSDTGAFIGFGINELLWTITLIMGAILLFLIGVLARLMRVLNQEKLGIVPEDRLTLWEKLLSLKPLSEEKNLTMDHKYDGIEELDNPTPPWFNFLFYGTIIFAIGYMVKYHVLADGKVQENEYSAELKEWEAKTVAYQATQTDLIDENNVQLISDATVLAETGLIFKSKCAACHGDLAEGKNGPNLTDEYWIHGGELKQVFKTITQGVPEKGMIPWKGLLKPDQIQNMASYILSIQGTVPEGAGKAPEGTKMEAVPTENTAPADSSNQSTASLKTN